MPESIFPLQITVIQDTLEQLEPAWTALWQRCPEATPFQHPLWLIPWWHHFGQGKILHTLVLRQGGELIGIAPCCILHEKQQRKLMLLGISLSDFLDALIAPGYESQAGSAILEHLARADWDVCDLQPIPATSPLFQATAPSLLESTIEFMDTLTSLELTSKTTALHQILSRHFSERIESAAKRAAILGQVRYETASQNTFDAVMNFLLRFHHARWGNPSEALSNPADAFHREAALAMLDRGTLRLQSLTISGRIAAVLYAFVHQRRGYFYLMAFDPAFAKISPGVLLMAHAIKELICEGVTGCEFLRGREAFKYRWAVTERPTYARRLHRKP